MFDPNHAQWGELYAEEDVEKEEVLALVALRTQQRLGGFTLGLIGFYIARYILWNKNIGNKFWHYTRFTAVPIWLLACGYTASVSSMRALEETGV